MVGIDPEAAHCEAITTEAVVIPIVLRAPEPQSLARTVGAAMAAPPAPCGMDSDDVGEGLWLVATAPTGLNPDYMAALLDTEERLLFKEPLRFMSITRDEQTEARPDKDTAKALARLGQMLSDQVVYVPDELSSELDGLRDLLCHARRVQSAASLLADKIRDAPPPAAQALLQAVATGFDAAADPHARALFLLEARGWTEPAAQTRA